MYKLLLIFLSSVTAFISSAGSHLFEVTTDDERKFFYAAFSSDDTLKMNNQLKLIAASAVVEKQAYTGALLMKKAGYLKTIRQKLTMFKEGKKFLETAISHDKQNAEYHFLRLAIQEYCPAILGYNKEVKEDADLVRKSFKIFAPDLKNAIIDYCKTSKVLQVSDLR